MQEFSKSESTEQFQPHGVVVPMITPLTAAAEIDCEGVARLVNALLAGGVHGLFALGSTGEFVALPWRRQRTLLRAVVECAGGRVPVYAGVSSNCLEEIMERAGEAAALGADAAVVLPPFYFRVSQPELIRYFTAVADRSPIPVVMYNMPFRTNNNIEPDTVETLAAHPNIAGIKDTVPDMARTLDVLGRVAGRGDFAYLHGNELLSLPAMLYGARGMVPSIANFAPRLVVDAYEAALHGTDLPAWQARIKAVMRVFSLLESRPQESTTLRLQAVKQVLELQGICGTHMAQLDQRPTAEQVEKVREFLNTIS